METPNTRSTRRRKRPDDTPGSQGSQPNSQEGSGITWSRDTELLDTVLAGPSRPLPLPSPTQRPRAFSSRSTSGLRKRPCRVRSATPSLSSNSLSTSPWTSLSTNVSSRSTEGKAAYDGKRLDELLEQFDLFRTPSSSSARSQRQPLGERTNRIQAAQSLPNVKTQAVKTKKDVKPVIAREPVRGTPVGSAQSLPDVQSDLRALANNARPPALPRVQPRVKKEPEEVDPRRPFRTPWAKPPGVSPSTSAAVSTPVRSSPRRKPPVDYSPRSLRAPAARATPSRLRQAHPPPLPPPEEQMPSSEGDTSVDSFDMLLNEGGDDVQDLFSMMDAYS